MVTPNLCIPNSYHFQTTNYMTHPSSISRHFQLLQRSTSLSHVLQFHSLFLKSPPSTFRYNSLIRAYTNAGSPHSAFLLFSDLHRAGTRPDNFTFPFLLKACSSLPPSMLEAGRAVHGLVVKTGFGSDRYVNNTLVHMYGTYRVLVSARKVFEGMRGRDVVSWSSMIEGCVSCDHPREALLVFQQMRAAEIQPNSVTLLSLLSACRNLGCLRNGQSIHSYIISNNIKVDVSLGTALIGMYAKCGQLEEGMQVFAYMKEKNMQSWTVMISALADHGRAEEAISLFHQLEARDLKPDSVLFSVILTCCSHAGLVEEGRKLFRRMIDVYKIRPTVEHYGCIVDLLGRAGMVEDAYKFIAEMPVAANSVMLRSLLGACRENGVVFDAGRKVTELLIEGEPSRGANYVLAANVAASCSNWSDAAELSSSIVKRGLKKVPGCSWVG